MDYAAFSGKGWKTFTKGPVPGLFAEIDGRRDNVPRATHCTKDGQHDVADCCLNVYLGMDQNSTVIEGVRSAKCDG